MGFAGRGNWQRLIRLDDCGHQLLVEKFETVLPDGRADFRRSF